MADNDKTKLLETSAEDEEEGQILSHEKNKPDSKFYDHFGDLFKRKKPTNKKLLLLIVIIIILLSIFVTLLVLIILSTSESSPGTPTVNETTSKPHKNSSVPTTVSSIPLPSTRPTTTSPLPIRHKIINVNITFNQPKTESNNTNSTFASKTTRLIDHFLKPFLKIKSFAKLFGSEDANKDIEMISKTVNRSLSKFSHQVEDFVDNSMNFTEAVVDRAHTWFWNVKTVLGLAEDVLKNIVKSI